MCTVTPDVTVTPVTPLHPKLQMNTADMKYKEVTDHFLMMQQEANSRREAVRAVSVAMQNSNLPPALCEALKSLADSFMPTAIADESEE